MTARPSPHSVERLQATASLRASLLALWCAPGTSDGVAAARAAFNWARPIADIAAGAELDAPSGLPGTPIVIATDTPIGHLALWLATESNAHAALVALLDRGVDPDAATLFGKTALMLAAQNNSSSVMRVLLTHGATVNRMASDGLTAIACAASEANLGAVDLLLAHGADPNGLDADTPEPKTGRGWIPLLGPARFQHIEILEKLLSAGASVDARTTDGNTALMLVACDNIGTETIPILVRYGADPLAANSNKQTVLDLAENLKRTKFLDVLDRALTQPEAGPARHRILQDVPRDRASRLLPRTVALQSSLEAHRIWRRTP